MKSIFLLLLPAIVLCSCHTQKQEDESAHAVTLKGDIIHIGSESPVLSKLTKETVKREPYRMEFTSKRANYEIVRSLRAESGPG